MEKAEKNTNKVKTTNVEELKINKEEIIEKINPVSAAIKSLTKKDIMELKSFKNPPEALKETLICISMLLNEKNHDWNSIQKLMKEPNAFLNRLINFDTNFLTEKQINNVRDYIQDKKLTLELVRKASVPCISLLRFVLDVIEGKVKTGNYGAEIANLFAEALEKHKQMLNNHRDYCGHGFLFEDQKYHLISVYDGYPDKKLISFENKERFLEWLGSKNDFKMSGCDESEEILYEKDPWMQNNQRITEKELINFIQLENKIFKK